MTPDETRKMAVDNQLRALGLDPEQVAKSGTVLARTVLENLDLKSLLTSRDAEIERLKAKLDSVWATQYQCPPCRNREHERHFIGEGKCACVPCFEKEYKVLDAEIERARELIRMAEKRRQCWDCDSKGGKHKIGCAVWKYLEAYVWEKPAQPKEEFPPKNQTHCSQCGQEWNQPACGPTHAMIYGERKDTPARPEWVEKVREILTGLKKVKPCGCPRNCVCQLCDLHQPMIEEALALIPGKEKG